MDTAMSVKRGFVSERSASKSKTRVHRSETQLAVYALIAGVLLLVVGAQVSDFLMVAGFFFAVSAGLALNALFWASYFEKHGEPKINISSRYFYE